MVAYSRSGINTYRPSKTVNKQFAKKLENKILHKSLDNRTPVIERNSITENFERSVIEGNEMFGYRGNKPFGYRGKLVPLITEQFTSITEQFPSIT